MDTLPIIYGQSINFGTSDASGYNCVGFNSISTHGLIDVLPKMLQDIDPSIGYDLAIVYREKIQINTSFLSWIYHTCQNILLLLLNYLVWRN
jgi:hypothetical protein